MKWLKPILWQQNRDAALRLTPYIKSKEKFEGVRGPILLEFVFKISTSLKRWESRT